MESSLRPGDDISLTHDTFPWAWNCFTAVLSLISIFSTSALSSLALLFLPRCLVCPRYNLCRPFEGATRKRMIDDQFHKKNRLGSASGILISWLVWKYITPQYIYIYTIYILTQPKDHEIKSQTTYIHFPTKYVIPKSLKTVKRLAIGWVNISGQIIIFHQLRFPWNKKMSLPIRHRLGEIGRVRSRANLTR